MPSLLSRIGNLAIPAAAARGAYSAGKTEGGRQSMLDKMQSALQGAQIDETKQRGEYYKSLGTDNWHESANGDIYNSRSGEVHHGAGKPPTLHGEEHYDPERNEVGYTTANPDGSVGWKKTRAATLTDKMRYQHMPRDGNDPAPEGAGVAENRLSEMKRKKADDLITAFLSAHNPEDLTVQKLQIFAGRILTDEERAALGRVRMPPAADRSFAIPRIEKGTSPKIVGPEGADSIGPKGPPPFNPSTAKPTGGGRGIRSVEMAPASSLVKRPPPDPQDEADKAELRRAHPEMNEAQIEALLRSLRTKPPEG